jgi:hypothetical protein
MDLSIINNDLKSIIIKFIGFCENCGKIASGKVIFKETFTLTDEIIILRYCSKDCLLNYALKNVKNFYDKEIEIFTGNLNNFDTYIQFQLKIIEPILRRLHFYGELDFNIIIKERLPHLFKILKNMDITYKEYFNFMRNCFGRELLNDEILYYLMIKTGRHHEFKKMGIVTWNYINNSIENYNKPLEELSIHEILSINPCF